MSGKTTPKGVFPDYVLFWLCQLLSEEELVCFLKLFLEDLLVLLER